MQTMLEKNGPYILHSRWNTTPRFVSSQEFHEEMLRPTGRFQTPLALRERIQFLLSRYANHFLITRDRPIYLANGTPLNWQVILNFLYREGILENPVFTLPRARADTPHKTVIALRPHYQSDITDARHRSFFGYGSSEDFDTAISKALGELLERYVGTIYRAEKMMLASTLEMQAAQLRFLPPEECSQFESWQYERFPELNYSEKTAFRWLLVDEITQKEQAYVPAQLMFWMYHWREQNEPLLIPMTSNGSAGHFTREEALVASIHEYVQRDGFLIYWMNTLSPRVIDLSDMNDPEISRILDNLTHFNLKAYFLNIATDLEIPTSACVLVRDTDERSFLSVGAATGKNARDSLISSYYEALAVQHGESEQENKPLFSLENYEPFTREDIDIDRRVQLWHGKTMREAASFFISGPRQSFAEFAASFPAPQDPAEELQSLIRRFRSRGSGYEIYAYESKHPVLAKLGYHVSRVFIPALVPMHLHERFAALANRRLADVPKKLGYTNPVRNVYPHPFP